MPILRGMGDSTFTNQLLIAMPTLNDPNFAQAVTLVCEHTDKGALGIVLNKPLPMKLCDVLTQMQLEPSSDCDRGASRCCAADPVHTDRGFVLHRPGGEWDHTHKVSDCIQVTTSRDILAAMARGEAPGRCLHCTRLRRLGLRPAGARDGATMPGFPCRPMRASCFDLPFEERWLAAWRFPRHRCRSS
jgi:putative transcriptional regulator